MTPPDARQRILEGVILRLARRPDAADFVLRGGLLLRHWFAPHPRPVEDVDLVAAFPFDEFAARRFLPVLADESVADGVSYDPDRIRSEGIWLGTAIPGVRVFATGEYDGTEIDFHTDLSFGPPVRPPPVMMGLPTLHGEPARVWACRPEAVAGHKVQGLWQRGEVGWRPKDLADLWQLLRRVPVDASDLRAAVIAYLEDVGGTPADARRLFGPGAWWPTKAASARWLDYADRRAIPRELADVVADMHTRLTPILEASP